MNIIFHPHCLERFVERGTNEKEVRSVIEQGERFPAKLGRVGFRRNISYDNDWNGKHYRTKQIEAFVVEEGDDIIVITVITKYF